MQQQLTQIRNAWTGFPRRARIAIIGVAAVTFLVLILVLRAASSTTWVPITEAGLTPEKLGTAQTALEEAGYEVQLNETSTAVEVKEGDANKAAAVLLTNGIAAKGGRTDCEKQFAENGMTGGTTATMNAKKESCKTNEVANTIEKIDGVKSAAVNVSLPGKELFIEDEDQAKASVVIDTDGGSLPKKAVSSIQNLVSSKFEGMTPETVSIIDERGTTLSDGGEDSSGSAEMMKIGIEDKYNTLVESKISRAMEEIVGEGKFSVLSNAELDLDQIDRGVDQYTPSGENGDSLVQLEDYEKELLSGVGQTDVQGVAGTGSNTGSAATATDDGTADTDNRTLTDDLSGDTGTADNGYANSKGARQFALNRVQERIKVAPGAVLRNRVNLTVDDSVPADTANAAKDAVLAYMGGNAQDSLAFNRAPIALSTTSKTSTAAGAASPIAGYVKWALLGIGIIGLAFVLRRALTQRTAELLAPANDLLLLDAGDFTPIPIAELEAALAAAQPAVERNEKLELQRKVEQIAESKPQDVANELRRWMHQEDTGYNTTTRR